MKNLLFLLLAFSVISFTACEREQALLNDVAGEWEVVTIDYQTDSGNMIPVDVQGLRLRFADCDPDASRNGDCNLTLTLGDGAVVPLEFNVLRTQTQNLPTLQIFGTDAMPIGFDTTLIGQTLLGSFGHQVNGNLLEAVSSKNGASFSINGQAIVDGRFTLRRP
jgi:hypothetical protein